MPWAFSRLPWTNADYMLEARPLVANRLDQGQKCRLDDNGCGLGIGELVGDLPLFIGRVDGVEDCSDAGDGVARDDELGPVRHKQAYPLTLLDTQSL